MPMRLKPLEGFGTLSAKRLARFESKSAVRLPDDYRQFLLEHNGCYPGGAYTVSFADSGKLSGSLIKVFLGIPSQAESCASIAWATQAYAGRFPPGFLPVAFNPGGD